MASANCGQLTKIYQDNYSLELNHEAENLQKIFLKQITK